MSRRVLRRASFCVAAALAATLTTQPALAGGTGQPDSQNRFSNVGAIVVSSGFPGVPFVEASGVLIHPRVLLTSGHVTAQAEQLLAQGIPVFDDFRVSFGTDAFDPSTWVEAVAILTHPAYRFKPEADRQDVGVIILKEPVDLPCATLAHEGLLDDLKDAGLLGNQGNPVKFLSVGYGKTLEFPPPEEVESDGLRRVSSPEYRAVENVWLLMNQNAATGNSGIAAGDSGGPVLWRAPDGALVVVALNTKTDAARVSLFKAYRTDTAEALGFIRLIVDLVDGGVL